MRQLTPEVKSYYEGMSPNNKEIYGDKYINDVQFGHLDSYDDFIKNTKTKTDKLNNSIAGSKIKQPSNDNNTLGLNTNDLISGGIGVLGSIGSALIQNNAINHMKYAPEPATKIAAKLKTKVNVNPQLEATRNALAESNRLIDNNTTSSKVALARRQRALTNAATQVAGIYAAKENSETELINKDRLNQQQVANANIDTYNAWRNGQAEFNNKVAESRANNYVSLVQNAANIGQDMLARPEKRNLERNNLIAIMAANPNVNPEYLRALGATWVTDEMITNWKKANNK